MEKLVYLVDLFKEYFVQSKAVGGFFILLIGVFLLVGSIKDWDLIFGDVNPVTYDLKKFDGIINVFGRKTARVIAGIGGTLTIIGGVIWIVICVDSAIRDKTNK